jgi:hypothetical protein
MTNSQPEVRSLGNGIEPIQKLQPGSFGNPWTIRFALARGTLSLLQDANRLAATRTAHVEDEAKLGSLRPPLGDLSFGPLKKSVSYLIGDARTKTDGHLFVGFLTSLLPKEP